MATMIDHLKQISADTEDVILACSALARRGAGGAAAAGSDSFSGGGALLSNAADTREIAKELAAAKEELRAHTAKVAEWERKVASAEEAQKVAAVTFHKGQRDVQMFKEQCAKMEEEAKAAAARAEAAEKRAIEARFCRAFPVLPCSVNVCLYVFCPCAVRAAGRKW